MSIDVDLHFGRRLYRRRRLLGLTQQVVANAVGVRPQQVQKYECAANRMSAARLWQMSQALDVPVAYFYEGLGIVQQRAIDEQAALTQVEARV